MTDTIRATFTLDYDTTREGQGAIVARLTPPLLRKGQGLQLGAIYLLVALGFCLSTLWIIGQPTNLSIFFVMLASSLASYALFSVGNWLDRKSYHAMPAEVTQTVEVTQTGLQFTAGTDHWATTWDNVHEIVKTDNAITLSASLSHAVIPTHALSDPTADFAQMQRWFQAARP